ncbi:hypothetical protein [Limnoglobus roseus]|uniref:Uncharacterized protein n=1 Tax=Limnoglobus roseus TaxID=2598579 RepID=A0A5C1AB45_9BACT|nr:hypothetical protein [Limnoglobus roseus]QEL16451.1 hypothetical protein PX52LOC_03405 [Limnoglobus roseus]
MTDIYKYAAQKRLRFPSSRGSLTIEQLFDLPLKSESNFDLDTVAKGINAQLKNVSVESFVEQAKPDPAKESLAVSLEIVKDVIKTKQEQNAAELNKIKKAADRKKILDAIGAKKDAALTAASLEDLEKQLAALD